MKLSTPPDITYDDELKGWLHRFAVTANREGGVVAVDVANARVGIGVTAPTVALDVNGAIKLAGNLTTAMGSSPYIGTTDAYGVNIGADSTTRIRIAAAGNVGINMSTTDPTHGTLEVTGTIYASGIITADSYAEHTKFFEGDALSALAIVKGKDGELDHTSLPDFMKIKLVTKVPIDPEDPSSGYTEVVEDGRDLGASISVLIVATQQLLARVVAAEAANVDLAKQIEALTKRVEQLEKKQP